MVDAIVIGSGFGGAVTACRLAERGLRVVVLERGRRWDPANYPRAPGDPWIFDVDRPEKRNGWLDFRIFDDMMVAQGAGVGGGSLIYANVSIPAPPATFTTGWPPEITSQELEPHYLRVGEMLGVQVLPDNQEPERTRLMREAARGIGAGDRFRKVPVAVTFDPDYRPTLPDPQSHRHSKTWVNPFGQQQGTCVHLGYCDIGCPVKAKNTLDLNYLARAEQLGVEIRPLHLVRVIRPAGQGYLVEGDRIGGGHRTPFREQAARVVVAAGSLNSTELLLRCRDEYHTLPLLSRRLGDQWSSNGDFLTPAWYREREAPIAPTVGPTITAAIDFLDGSRHGARFFIEDGGLPDLFRAYLDEAVRRPVWSFRWRRLLKHLRRATERHNVIRDMMPWFAQGVDAADGRLRLARPWYAPWRRALRLDWDIAASRRTIKAIIKTHEELSRATGGEPDVPLTWSLLENLITPHPLGGCVVGRSAADGVVDHRGAVFGYPGLYLADGSIVPEALGLNPSRTIAALAERIAALID